jgi:hypothetical protein
MFVLDERFIALKKKIFEIYRESFICWNLSTTSMLSQHYLKYLKSSDWIHLLFCRGSWQGLRSRKHLYFMHNSFLVCVNEPNATEYGLYLPTSPSPFLQTLFFNASQYLQRIGGYTLKKVSKVTKISTLFINYYLGGGG